MIIDNAFNNKWIIWEWNNKYGTDKIEKKVVSIVSALDFCDTNALVVYIVKQS